MHIYIYICKSIYLFIHPSIYIHIFKYIFNMYYILCILRFTGKRLTYGGYFYMFECFLTYIYIYMYIICIIIYKYPYMIFISNYTYIIYDICNT